MNRRNFFSTIAGASALASVAGMAGAQTISRKGRLKQGITTSCMPDMAFEDICSEAARLGAKGVDLVGPSQFAIVRKYGLVPSMVPSASGIREGIIHKELHDAMARKMLADIDVAAAAGAPNVIVLSGVRKRPADRAVMSDEQGHSWRRTSE